jgi:hypothetical protein
MAGGLEASAYCSGWADPVAMKTQAVSWGVPRIILDDESGIRSLEMDPTKRVPFSQNRYMARKMLHGGEARPVLEMINGVWTVSAWVQPWLNASGSGQYGNEPVFAGVSASCYVFAAYPGGDPGASWPSYYARPAGGHPCGWQFQGTHVFSGIGVDSTNYDDSFWTPSPVHPTEDDMLYTGAFHTLTATLKQFAAGSIYSDPSTAALGVGALGASVAVTGFLFANSGVQSTDRGAGAGPGIDYVWWKLSDGHWVSDALLNTVGVAGAPIGAALSALPAGMTLYFAKESELASVSGVTMIQVTGAITTALAKLPATGLTKDQVDAEILTALGNFKPVPGGPHHHSVLGIINTGPVITD